MLKPDIEHKIWINVSRDRAWRAISQTEQIKHWWGADGYAEITNLSAGATINFGTGDRLISATISLVDPPHEFVYAWPPHPRYFSVPFVTRYILDEDNGGTQVTFRETGFTAWPDDEPRRARYERINNDFRMLLENLKAYLEGKTLPHIF